jgi:hypothetical protein
MAQMMTYSFTSAASPVNVDINVGFDVASVEIVNQTGQGSTATPGVVKRARWSDTMAAGSAAIVKNTDGAATDTPSFISSAGFSMITDGAIFGSAISAYTNANPAVITVTDAVGAGFAVGDTVRIAEMAYSGAGTNPNQEYVIASISGNAITTTEDSTAYGVRVSGGNLFRVKDTLGKPVAINNRGQRKLRIGTGLQAASSLIHVVIHGKNCVV